MLFVTTISDYEARFPPTDSWKFYIMVSLEILLFVRTSLDKIVMGYVRCIGDLFAKKVVNIKVS